MMIMHIDIIMRHLNSRLIRTVNFSSNKPVGPRYNANSNTEHQCVVNLALQCIN